MSKHTPYDDQELQYLISQLQQKTPIYEIIEHYNEQGFEQPRSASAIKEKIHYIRKQLPELSYKSPRITSRDTRKLSDEQKQFIVETVPKLSIDALTEQFNETFETNFSKMTMRSICKQMLPASIREIKQQHKEQRLFLLNLAGKHRSYAPMQREFEAAFDTKLTRQQFENLCKSFGIEKTGNTMFSAEQKDWIQTHKTEMNGSQLTKAFNETFGTNHHYNNIAYHINKGSNQSSHANA